MCELIFVHCGFHRWGKDLSQALEGIEIDASGDIREYSRNYLMDASTGPVETSMQGNVIFDPSSQLPREAMLKTTLSLFGEKVDLLEVRAYSLLLL